MKKTVIALLTILLASALIGGIYLLNSFGVGASTPNKPPTSGEAWVLRVDGLVDKPYNLTWQDLLAMPSKNVTATLWCVGDQTGESASIADWTGVPLETILERAGISDGAVKVAFYAKDDYTTDLTIAASLSPDVLIAYKENGGFLPEDGDGHPSLRLVVPGKWGYKWINMLFHIELINYDFKGFWESRGYSDEATLPGVPFPR